MPRSDVQSLVWREIKDAPPWKPKPNDEILGVYRGIVWRTSYGKFPSNKQERYRVVMIDTPDGHRTIGGMQLLEILEAAKIAEGTALQILFLGFRETALGHQMRCYRVRVGEETLATGEP